ncbi:Arylsulfatase A [Reichenbachiella faecimaris]|uniref:Arylsulfatase A n=1 Tax=Reichenbachiella faecimaris TaxID=692418 RepID=A0A1W2GAZ4_REIFA|nr:sulfatase-like hydrolase/transferase [Reichenbachiella faecimaris]SMD33849.1 Arylsulfatase A [Reichenbachiella faecimaris]
MKKLKLVFLLILSLAVSGLASAQDQNVLFIAVDDLKPLLGAYGDEMAITPNIDRLAAMGVTFTNTQCQQAVCGPSRASLLTGMRPDVTEVWDLKTLIRDKNPNIVTLPQYFRSNGYETVGIGKIFDPRSVDKGLDEKSWSVPYLMPDVEDEQYGEPAGHYQSPENKAKFEALRKEGEAKGLSGGKLNAYVRNGNKPTTESLDIADEGYFDGMVAVEAIKQLKNLASGSKPFLLCVGFKKPHLPFVAPKKYWDMYKRENMPLAEFQKQASGTVQLSYHNSGELNSYTDIPDAYGKNGLVNEDKQRELIHGYYACISYVDAQIGKVLDALEAQNLAKNTSIVLWGDHGWHLGDHGMWNKHSNFEQATRSPLIFASTTMQQGVQNDSPTEFVDIFPTLCDLTDLETPDYLQGKSLKPILDGKEKSVKPFAISQYPRAKNMGYAMRNDRYRYVVWYKDGDTSSPSNILAKELYDYKKDPLETQNVVGSNKALADELQSQLDGFLVNQETQKKAFKKSMKQTVKIGMAAPVVGSGANLVSNPGFENGLEGWKTFGKCGIKVVNEEAHAGSASLQFTGSKGGVNRVIKGLKPETTYEVSVFAKTQNNEAVILKLADFGGEEAKAKHKANDYGQMTASFTTGAGATSVKIGLQKYGDGTGKSWFDEVQVVEKKSKGESIQGVALKDALKDGNKEPFYIGATMAHSQLGTDAQDILVSQFNYTVSENAAKQTKVHPAPGEWNWQEVDAIVDMAKANNLVVRLHGPISPQASKWAKADERTPKELEKIMTEFFTAQCKRFNGHPNIKWMDVVNETVEKDGTWFSPKPGVKDWENPWTIIGADKDKNQTPIYISKAFEMANQYAPTISLVYNQHGGMEPPMWERVKETILYLKDKGLRVDGIGWQAHLRSDEPLAFAPKELNYLAELIDWTHANDLDFHVTEIDYKLWDRVKTADALKKQGEAYANILKVLLAKRSTGVVTYNTWGILDGHGKHADKFMFMFDEDGNPKPAYFAVREALINPNSTVRTVSKTVVFSDGFENGDFEKSWKQFGDTKPSVVNQNAEQGQACVALTVDKSGIKRTLESLKPNTKYTVEASIKSPKDMKSVVKVDDFGGEQVVERVKGNGDYQKAVLSFTTGATATSAQLIINRWNTAGEGQVLIDAVEVSESAN